MPKTTKGGKPKKDELPSTLRRSNAKAQRTFSKAHDAAADEYGSEQRAHRVAYAALKHSFEKVGDRWLPKKKKGPSDKRAERGGLNNPDPLRGGSRRQRQQETSARCCPPTRHPRTARRWTSRELVDAIKKHNRKFAAGKAPQRDWMSTAEGSSR